MANSADPDQLASLEANWSGSTLFANAGYIWVQQDTGQGLSMIFHFFQKEIELNSLFSLSPLETI